MKYVSLLALILCSLTADAQRPDKFCRDMEGKKIVYNDVKSYYGYIAPGAPADEVVEGKRVFYIYFALNDSLEELAVRLVHPVPDLAMPDKGDIVADEYYQHEHEQSASFDGRIFLQRCASGSRDQLAKCRWKMIFDDNAASVIRLYTKKDIIPAVYRIGITTAKPQEMQGGYLVQIGSTSMMQGMKPGKKTEFLQTGN
jgi:hypothetical protein